MSTARRWVGPLGWAVSIVALAAVVWWASRQDPPTLPDTPGQLGALVGACLLYGVAALVRGERWRLLLRECGASPSRADCAALTCVGYMGNNVLPARAGDAMRAVYMAPRAGTDTRTVIGTLLAERLLDVVVLACAFVTLAVVAVNGEGLPSGDTIVTLTAVAGAVAAVASLAIAVLHRRGLLHRAWALVAPMATSTRRLRGRHGAEMLLATVAIWSLELSVWWACAVAADLGVDAVGAAYILALASMFATIPAAPGQVGTLDAAIVLGARALGRPQAAAVAYLLLLRFVLIVPITIVGFVVLVTRYGGLQGFRNRTVETAP